MEVAAVPVASGVVDAELEQLEVAAVTPDVVGSQDVVAVQRQPVVVDGPFLVVVGASVQIRAEELVAAWQLQRQRQLADEVVLDIDEARLLVRLQH